MKKMNDSQYLDFIRSALTTDGIGVADCANKIALEMGAITVDQYSKAARVIVTAYLNQ